MIFVRHGESEFNVVYRKTQQDPGIRDPKVTARGARQIQASARYIADHFPKRFSQIVTSPYTRTLQSSKIIADILDLPIHVDALVGEHAYFTCDIGTPVSALKEAWNDIDFDHLDEEWWPQNEQDHHVNTRASTFRAKMAVHPQWDATLVVSHWGFVRSLTGLSVQNATIVQVDPTRPHPEGGEVVWVPDV